MNSTTTRPYIDSQIDIKLKLSALWVAMMFVFAYVDIFGLFRADILEGLLDGVIAGTPLTVSQGFLIFTVIYILPGSLMVFFSLTMPAARNRIVNIVVASLYIVTIAASCVGEGWIYYLLGSAIEIVLLAILIRMALRWPAASN